MYAVDWFTLAHKATLVNGKYVDILQVKCHHYWPDTGAETFNQYQVVAHATNDYQEYTLREFKLVDKKVC